MNKAYPQNRKTILYHNIETDSLYSQVQYDSIKRVSTPELGKEIVLAEKKEKGSIIEYFFSIISVKSIVSVRYKWENKLFPAFSLENKQGDFVDNASLKGKVAVFNFWSVTCIPCLEEMPYLNRLVENIAPTTSSFWLHRLKTGKLLIKYC